MCASHTPIKLLMLGFALCRPAAAAAQHEVRLASAEPLRPIHRCAAVSPATRGPIWSTLMEVVELDEDVAKRRLRALQDSATAVAAAQPGDVESQFTLAAVLGARAEVEDGRTKIHVAEALIDQLDVVLALDPDHPGALDLLGRLHASVMRLDGITRFIATRIMGGDKLRTASWQEAERLLQRAISSEPCLGDHRFQLARVYADQGKHGQAREQLRELLVLGPRASLDQRVWGGVVALAAELDAGE